MSDALSAIGGIVVVVFAVQVREDWFHGNKGREETNCAA